MNTNKVNETVGNHAPLVVLISVMAITIPALFGLGHKLFPKDVLRQVSLVGVSELSLVLWHVAHNHAKGDKQNSIASFMVWLSVAAVSTLAGLDILLMTAESKQIPVEFDKNLLGGIVTFGIPGLILANLIGTISYQNADPVKALAHAKRQADFLIENEAVRQIKDAAGTIAADVARVRTKDYIAVTRAQNLQRLTAGHVAESDSAVMNADAPRVAQLVAAPAGPGDTLPVAPEIDYDKLAAAMARLTVPVAPVQEAEAKK